MSRILFIDTASNCFRPRDKSEWEPHMVRYAAILEVDEGDDGTSETRVVLVRPEKGWRYLPETSPYHKAGPEEMEAQGVPIGVAAAELQDLLRDVRLIVWHSANFHRKVMGSVFADAGIGDPPPPPETFDTCGGSADVVRVRLMSNGQWKPPSLAEAYRHFTGEEMVQSRNWRDHAVIQVNAVREVYQGVMRERGH